MATIGRAIRYQQRADARQGPDTIFERLAQRKAAELAVADRQARFPVLTAENAQEAIDYQEQRIAHHLKATRQR